jgi:hypothetical protein
MMRCGDDALQFAPDLATGREQIGVGGLKTKSVDVIITKEGIGPLMVAPCISMAVPISYASICGRRRKYWV